MSSFLINKTFLRKKEKKFTSKQTTTNDDGKTHFIFRTRTKENNPILVANMFEMDLIQNTNERSDKISTEEQKILSQAERRDFSLYWTDTNMNIGKTLP